MTLTDQFKVRVQKLNQKALPNLQPTKKKTLKQIKEISYTQTCKSY